VKFRLDYPEAISVRRREIGMNRAELARISRVDYTKIRDMEHARYKRIDAPILEAVAFALKMHPAQISNDYEPPEYPEVRFVGVNARMVRDHLDREGISGTEFAKRAGVSHNHIYGLINYGQQTVPADVARKLAREMGFRGFEFAPALGLYKAPDGEMMLDELVGRYGGSTPEDVEPLPGNAK
jgi:ribosome-binding protein aMBF1 (putative translation factor)